MFFPPFIFEKLSVAHILRQSCSCQTEKVLLLWVHLNIEIQNEKYLLYCWGVTFHSLLFTRRRCSLAIAESLVTSCKIRSLLVTRCKSTCWSYPLQSYSLPVTHCIFTRCKFVCCLLLVVNSFVACYSMQIHSLLVTCCKFICCSLLVAKLFVAHYLLKIHSLLITCSKSIRSSWLVANSFVARYWLQIHSFLVTCYKFIRSSWLVANSFVAC